MGEGSRKPGWASALPALPPLLPLPECGHSARAETLGSKSLPAGGTTSRWLPRVLPDGWTDACCSDICELPGVPVCAAHAASGEPTALCASAGAAADAGPGLRAAAGPRLLLVASAASGRG